MMRWLDILFPPRSDEQTLRAIRTDDFATLLTPFLVPQTRPASVGLLPYSSLPVRAAIHEAKYHGSAHAFDLLAAVLVEYLQDADLDLPRARLVPIPLGRERLKERGFNQVEEVAKRAAKKLGLPVESDLLTRTRETLSQVSLPRKKREENMRGAFRAARDASPTLLYIVVDDVLTTGATLQAALDALTAAGARNLAPVALAH